MSKKKKHHSTHLTHAARLRHARLWLNDPSRNRKKNIISAYRNGFHLDFHTAVKDLRELNVPLSKEVLEQAEKNEEERIRALHAYKEKKKQKSLEGQYDSADDHFIYIAGYTSNGVPYGYTWEEEGIDPNLSFEDKVKELDKKYQSDVSVSDKDDFPF